MDSLESPSDTPTLKTNVEVVRKASSPIVSPPGDDENKSEPPGARDRSLKLVDNQKIKNIQKIQDTGESQRNRNDLMSPTSPTSPASPTSPTFPTSPTSPTSPMFPKSPQPSSPRENLARAPEDLLQHSKTPVSKPQRESDTAPEIYDSASRPKTPANPKVLSSPRSPTPKAFTLDKIPISLSQEQPEVELILKSSLEIRKNSGALKSVDDDAVTITKVPKRSQVDRPKTPVTRSKTPVVRPNTPVLRPRTPGLRPKTPVERPKTPGLTSKTPAERPKTPGVHGSSEKKRRQSIFAEGELDKEVEKIIQESEDEGRRKRRRHSRDNYCWKCHKDGVEAACSTCVRSWHRRCIGGTAPSASSDWICGECASILKAENPSTRSPSMSNLTVDQLCMVLKHIILKMKQITGAEEFSKPVDLVDVPNYLDYIIKPMDLTLLEGNIKSKEYGSPDAFMADAKWILHNCLVFNTEGGKYTDTSKLTTVAKQLIKLAREEVSELESCPTCYVRGRHLPRPNYTWFIDACSPPHLLVWAKLKGFPYWPAKVMPRWNNQGYVDVRFFGEHNRAWVSPKDLYLYSKDPPAGSGRSKKHEIADCLREISIHIKRLGETFGRFEHAPHKTQFNPHDPLQIKTLLPDYDPPLQVEDRIPRRVIGKGKKRKWDSLSDSVSEAYFYSDAETLAGDFNEDDEEDDDDDGKESPRKRKRSLTPGLPEAPIPGKRSRQIKVSKPTPRRGSAGKGMRGGRRSANFERESRGRGSGHGRSTRQASERISRRPRSTVGEMKNEEAGNNEEIAGKVAEKMERMQKIPQMEKIEKLEEKQEKQGLERKHRRAKKSFPNKPPGIGASTGQRPQVKSPVKLEKSFGVPADAGPLSSLISKGADTLAKQMGLIIEESIKQATQGEGPVAGIVGADRAIIFDMKLRMERIKWEHQQEIAELKQISEKTWREDKAVMETEHLRALEELRKTLEEEKFICIAETKGKQWCVGCGVEACMNCCWNTSYCSESCQELDWRKHQTKCMRRKSITNRSVASTSRVNGQKEQSEAIPKSMSTPNTTSYVRGA
ncbi:protein kinase C-binding protein 1 [Fopius arisanus]|uniref:Protein kinase C-binding protein 1 n=2 Tax=Fopius arisanus TaxID=64838 RepID=A0A9R1TQH3_9HYME|nr:PREDICTED: protein kinase C-binding protein 1 [Fopius arisanus]